MAHSPLRLASAALRICTAALAVSACASSVPAPGPPAPTAAALGPLDALDGATVDPARFADRIVVLDFMSVWCEPCVEGLPDQVALEQRYGPRGVDFVLVAQDEDPEPLRQLVARHHVRFPVALDARQRWFEAFGLRFVPSLVVLDRRGAIALHFGAGEAIAPQRLAETLDALLADD